MPTKRDTLTTAVKKRQASTDAPANTTRTTDPAAQLVLQTILACLDDAKAADIVTIEISGKSALGDYMVVASGRSQRHVNAIADQLLEALRSVSPVRPRIEGMPHCDWVLVDMGDVIIHIFRPEVREFYALEKMWQMPDIKPPESG